MPLSDDPEKRARQMANLQPGAGAWQPGAAPHLVNGTRTRRPSAITLSPLVAEIAEALGLSVPLRDADDDVPLADRMAVELAAIQLLTVRRVSAYIDLNGEIDARGNLRPEVAALSKAVDAALRALGQLGCTPAARARLGLDLAQADRARRPLTDHLDEHYPVDAEASS